MQHKKIDFIFAYLVVFICLFIGEWFAISATLTLFDNPNYLTWMVQIILVGPVAAIGLAYAVLYILEGLVFLANYLVKNLKN
jgi:hypothetical protein